MRTRVAGRTSELVRDASRMRRTRSGRMKWIQSQRTQILRRLISNATPQRRTSEKSIELKKDDDDSGLSVPTVIASASRSSDIAGVVVAMQQHEPVIQGVQETNENESAILAGIALLGETMCEASSSTGVRDGYFQPAVRPERGVNRAGRHIKVTCAGNEMYVYIRTSEGDCFESNTERVSETEGSQRTVELPLTLFDDGVKDSLVVQRSFKTNVESESTSKRERIPMLDTELHVSHDLNEHDRLDMVQTADCDRKEGTATAAENSSKRCDATSSEQCKIDSFAMDGRQNTSEDIEDDGKLRSDDCYRELTAEENTWWAKEMEQQIEAWASDN